MVPVLYLDMDGVCCDFVSEALRAHGSPLKPEDITEWNMENVMGITLDEFWAPIEAEGTGFWRGLKEYPWFEELYRICGRYAKEVVFLSSPDRSPAAAMGKMQWLQDRFGPCFRDYILTPRKDLVANAEGLLIDDNEKHVSSWSRNGAPCVLFPQPWNSKGVQPMFLTKLCETLQFASDTYERIR